MPRTETVEIRVMDSAEVQAALDAAREEIERLTTERDEWEARYEWLLGEVGGTAPQ